MVLLGARLKRNSVKPLSLNLTPTTVSTSSTKQTIYSPLPSASGSIGSGSTFYSSNYSIGSARGRGSAMSVRTASTSPGADSVFSESDADQWRGSPVFDAEYWHSKGGMDLLRTKHAELCETVEALTISCSTTDTDWHWHCLALGWPNVYAVDIEFDACNAESDPSATRWLRIIQDKALFPMARVYRLTSRWAGCTEVFEHPLGLAFGSDYAERLALLDKLPAHIQRTTAEMRFLVYRLLFLVSVTFDMATMAKTSPGALAMYTYIVYLLKTDIFSPVSIGFVDAQPQDMQRILETINANAQQLVYAQMRTSTGNTALQSSLKRLRLDMRNMADGRHTIPFCAAHFPALESLVVGHSPDFKNALDSPMSLSVLFSLPWQNLVELQLPFVSDQLVGVLRDKCPAMQYLYVRPEPRYERWTAYSHGFSPSGLARLARQWPTLRQLVVRYAFRQASSADQDHSGHPAPPPSRTSFSASRISTLALRSSTINSFSASLDPSASPAAKSQFPGPQPCDSFFIRPRNTSLRVLRIPYLQIPFSAAIAMLVDVPQLRIFEFASLLKDHEVQHSTGLTSTLRRRISVAIDPLLSVPFAESDVVYRIQEMKHPLRNMILHEACTTRYISTSWIQIINSFAELDSVKFVAIKSEDSTIAQRVRQFCLGNNANFAVEIDDQSRSYQTCADFTNSWEKAGKLMLSR
ncbi:hypothetical protein GGI15_001424 [Coemansia interrupta]|uniref:Uncharacterized protein n=1 Tax=Coemansia interrupta TaxID=1126814 RepID=A0A9W8HIG1_9FUNG|nr:hypothetical protein GGI15_001424 [Coemansia interrupta]